MAWLQEHGRRDQPEAPWNLLVEPSDFMSEATLDHDRLFFTEGPNQDSNNSWAKVKRLQTTHKIEYVARMPNHFLILCVCTIIGLGPMLIMHCLCLGMMVRGSMMLPPEGSHTQTPALFFITKSSLHFEVWPSLRRKALENSHGNGNKASQGDDGSAEADAGRGGSRHSGGATGGGVGHGGRAGRGGGERRGSRDSDGV